jgi:hypothetical protein
MMPDLQFQSTSPCRSLGRIVVCSTQEGVFKSDPQNTCVSGLHSESVADVLEPGTNPIGSPSQESLSHVGDKGT